MKCYRLKESTSLKEIGVFPQIEKAIYKGLWDAPNSLTAIYMQKVNPEDIDIPEFLMHRKAKQTDLLSKASVSFKLVVSPRLKAILEATQYNGVQFLKTVVHNSSKNEAYWILNPFGFRNQYVDFNASIVQRGSGASAEFISVRNEEAFDQLRKERKGPGQIVFIKDIVLKASLIQEDLFLIAKTDGGLSYIVSENIKTEIIAVGCTGIEFEEVTAM